MSGSQRFYIQHIVDALARVASFTSALGQEEFLKSDLHKAAVVRELEVIGEAAKNVESSFRKAHADIPWRRMAGMRDKLIHHYFGVDYKAVWDTIQNDLPALRGPLLRILDE